MKLNDRVKHEEYGKGIIIHIMYEGTRRELLAVRFDKSDSSLHGCFGLCEDNHGKFFKESELEILE